MMFGIKLNLNMISQLALAAATGGTSMFATMAMKTIGTAIAQQVIQQLGQKLGLPQGIINMAQQAFAQASGTQGSPISIKDAVGQLGQQFNLPPVVQGQLERAANSDAKSMFQQLLQASKDGEKEAEMSTQKGKGSWLQIFAKAMGKALDAKLAKIDEATKALEGDKQSISKSQDLNVATQEFSFMMQAASNAIKTIGEGMNAMARKG